LAGLLTALAGELLIGLAIGLSVKLIVSGIQVAGSTISVQTGLALAQTVDPAQGTMGTLFGTFLSILSITMIFAADLHHVLLGAMNDSYQLFPPGELLPSAAADFAKAALETISAAFRIALQLAAPFLIFGLIFYLGLGVLTRLIPQVQIFFVIMPANIMLGFVLFMLLLSTLMLWFLSYFGDAIKPYLN
jgi:flagellar biosynthetic protein FliR